MIFEKALAVEETPIPGLLLVDLAVHKDSRGWLKENWQREKMLALGVPDRRWVQNNVSYNVRRGVVRGVHAEPCDKWVSVVEGTVFGVWVDLRAESPAYGKVFTAMLDPSKATYVPRGVGNGFQSMEDGSSYTYLMDVHWSAALKDSYTFVNVADPQLDIPWPIPLEECEISEADKKHPGLADVKPMEPRRTLVTGANGQLGRAVRAEAEARGLMAFDYTDIDEFDFSDAASYDSINWVDYGTVINCGAYTAADMAETTEGRAIAWKSNAVGPALLARICAEHDITLVHVSSDYIFDGRCEVHDEEEAPSPLGVYGQSKAAGDLAVMQCPNHFIVRSSWVVGDGRNFARTMAALSDRCTDAGDALDHVTVVNDQLGRLTFADDMARGILWLLGYREGSPLAWNPSPCGTYNLTGSGRVASWFEIAQRVFELRNGNQDAVVPVTTAEYYATLEGAVTPRPVHSALDLAKIEAVGFHPRDWEQQLTEYVCSLPDGKH